MTKYRIVLADNGSLEPGSTLKLRSLAAELGRLIGHEVRPVSMMHSGKVAPELLGGEPAVLFRQEAKAAAEDGAGELIVVPLFLGPGRTLTETLPEQFREAGGGLRLRVAPPLYGADGALRRILAENLLAAGWKRGAGSVLLCDHGSPSREMTAVRDALAAELRAELKLGGGELTACSMERRPGAAYDFNEPSLASAIEKARGEAVVLMQFLLPGRHAGRDGDVAGICRGHAPRGLSWKLSPLIGESPLLPALLAERFRLAAKDLL